MRCKSCDREVKSDFKYCPYCAARLIQDFGDHYEELEPPYSLQPENLDDPAAILYGQVADPPLFQPTSPISFDDLLLPEEDFELPELPPEEAPPAKEPQSGQARPYQVYKPGPDPQELERPLSQEYPADFSGGFSADFAEEPASPFVANLPDEPDEPPRTRGFASKHPPAPEAGWMEDAPYLSMQPERPVGEQDDAKRSERQGPGIFYRLLLVLFIISMGALASIVLYRFCTTPDPLDNFRFSTLFASCLL